MIRVCADATARRMLGGAALGRLRRRMRAALAAADAAETEVSILLCGDARIRALNRDYAEEDHATDVLSFSQREGLDSPAAVLLGDIVVSVEAARRQAADRRGPAAAALEAEILQLAVHGLAHLLGFDHDIPARRRAMQAHEAALMRTALGASSGSSERGTLEGFPCPPAMEPVGHSPPGSHATRAAARRRRRRAPR